MAKDDKIPAVEKVRVMDPEWHVKFKSLRELRSDKSAKVNEIKSDDENFINND
jgi:hypothetical protein